MNIYDNYLSTIKSAIDRDKQSRNLSKGLSGYTDIVNGERALKTFLGAKIDMNPLPSLQHLATELGLRPNVNQKLGEHPDFKHLKHSGDSENHYIVSVFIDISNSTSLFREYEPDTILIITNTIQRAAIHTCITFGGYVHRLEGDGLFAYFGGKGIDKWDATVKAITAASMFTYFVKNDLKKIFDEEGIEDISTKIGMDFGDDDKVLWAKAGIGDCSEITTYSLHTSLASKMQKWAKANGIVVGDNIKERLSAPSELFSLVTNSNGDVVKRYIWEDRKKGFYYTQYEFNWLKYLKSLPYISDSGNGEFTFRPGANSNSRLDSLRNTASLISAGNAFTNSSGNITNSEGVKNQPHRFHYEG